MRRTWSWRVVVVVGLLLVACSHHASGQDAAPPTTVSAQERAAAVSAATGSDLVRSLAGGRRLQVAQVVPWHVGAEVLGAQVAISFAEGPARVDGQWPRLVVDNPARCETCEPDGPLRWHFESVQESIWADGLLVGVDRTGTVREIRPIPVTGSMPSPATAPPTPPTPTIGPVPLTNPHG